MSKGLSKSKLISYCQCPKKLYLETYQKEAIEVTPEQQKIFDTGHAVGELAQQFYPDGVLIKHDQELHRAIEETQSLLSNSDVKTLFEATFSHNKVLVRVDLLHKTKKGLHIQEVKSATSVKDVNITDCAIQKWVLEGSGYKVEQLDLTHINNQFIYEVEGQYDGIFSHESLLGQAESLQENIETWVNDALAMLASEKEPETEPGDHCSNPYTCNFIDYCSPETTKWPVDLLPRGGKTVQELKDEGIHDIRDIPEGRLSNANHERVRRVTVAGKYELDKSVSDVINGFGFPRYYIDFETIQFAIPRWIGTKPYNQLSFQWSCHIEDEKGNLEHREFLDISGDDPSEKFIKGLIDTVGKKGPIFVYNAGFEKTRLNELVVRFPEYKKEVENILERIIDLWPIAKKYYYHPDMRGSWSIKSVLPTIAPELNYSELDEVQDGGGAQSAYLEAIDEGTTEERREAIRKNMIEYCKLDTLAMVKMVKFFS